jgi:hypothetical protein
MTRRRVLCGLLLASALLVCGAGVWLASRPRVTQARFEQVEKGMTREEVVRIVGGPPGDYTSDGRGSTFPYADGDQVWVCDSAALVVRFDDNDRAAEVLVLDPRLDVHFYFGLILERPPTFTERIRRWLGL